jgi:HEAT repeat protein
VTTDDVLAGLDEIEWSELEHAYGSAEDVPGLLRALLSGSPDERKKTIHSLYGNIFHQGTRYEATRYAVPFLAKLALHPDTFQRQDIVYLLGSITVGYDESYLPRGIDIAGQRAEIEQLRLVDRAERMREVNEWVDAATDEADRRRRETRRAIYDIDFELRSAEDQLGAYDAVRRQIPALRDLLEADNPDLRAATAYLLGWFPEEAPTSIEALRNLLRSETIPGITANAIVSVGLLGGSDLVPCLREFLEGTNPLLRWAAAIALARLDQTDPAVIQTLADATATPPEQDTRPGVRFLDGDLRGYASQTLSLLADSLTPEAFDAVLDGLSRSAEIGTFSIASAALRLAFPSGPVSSLPPFEQLSDRQRRVVRVLADLGPETWRWGNFMGIMSAWKLPGRHAQCREYAGLAPLEGSSL